MPGWGKPAQFAANTSNVGLKARLAGGGEIKAGGYFPCLRPTSSPRTDKISPVGRYLSPDGGEASVA